MADYSHLLLRDGDSTESLRLHRDDIEDDDGDVHPLWVFPAKEEPFSENRFAFSTTIPPLPDLDPEAPFTSREGHWGDVVGLPRETDGESSGRELARRSAASAIVLGSQSESGARETGSLSS